MTSEAALRRWLAAHADSPSVVPDDDDDVAPARVAWLTGQSSFAHSRLSLGQERVLTALAEHGWEPVRLGFPWTRSAATRPYRATPLPLAGSRNIAQGALALEGPHTWFAREIARHAQPLLDATSERLLLLCASAGWPMLAAALPHLSAPPGLRVDAVAVGGIGGALAPPPGWRCHAIRGSRDLASALAGPAPCGKIVPGGHLRAATGPQTAAAILALLGAPAQVAG